MRIEGAVLKDVASYREWKKMPLNPGTGKVHQQMMKRDGVDGQQLRFDSEQKLEGSWIVGRMMMKPAAGVVGSPLNDTAFFRRDVAGLRVMDTVHRYCLDTRLLKASPLRLYGTSFPLMDGRQKKNHRDMMCIRLNLLMKVRMENLGYVLFLQVLAAGTWMDGRECCCYYYCLVMYCWLDDDAIT